MPTGIVLSPNPQAINVVDDVVAQASRAHHLGVRQVWLGQRFDHGAIALAALVGAALAQTAQSASHGNFSLGLGLGAHEPERQAFGTSWPNTITRLREHLTVLRSIFGTGAADFRGNEISAQPGWPGRVAGGTPVPVYVAAMGPKALQVTGELADGTQPYLAGPRTSRVHRTGHCEVGRRRWTA
jgi:alkanesulfonate monooxygenase SsuD/methylene tetrahydromethanopterin reductase-like flavin-dependent oxidoreductase (luciferase family)